jgi:LCP family protein required for cell wall assembly
MAQQNPPPDHSRAGRIGRVLVSVGAALALVVATGSGAAFAYYFHLYGSIRNPTETTTGIQREKNAERNAPGSKIVDQCQESGCNFLLLGSDSRSGLSKQQQEEFGTNKDIGGSQRSDTIMVVHVPPGNQKAVILSFPRDLWVHIPGHGIDKINAAFEGGVNGGGAQVVASTLYKLSGLRINHWMYVDLAGFEGLVNALGGVHMCVPSPMYDPLTALSIRKPGCQDFSGQTALAYVRTRHWKASPSPTAPECDVIGDFARIGRQQQFLRAIFAKVLSPSELLHVQNIMPKLLQNFVVDKGLNPADLAYFVGQLQGLTTGAADFRTVPTKVGWANVNYPPYRLSIVSPIQPQANDLFRRILNNQPLGDLGKEQQDTPPSPANISVQVFDHDSQGTAATALKTLQDSGFLAPTTVSPYASLKKPEKGSVLLYRQSAQPMADVVAGYLPNLKLVAVPDSALPDAPVAAVISSGYQPAQPGTSSGGGGGGGGTAAAQCPA